MEDRRIFERIEIRLPLSFYNPFTSEKGSLLTVDISADGFGVISEKMLPQSTLLDFWLHIPDEHEPFFTRGKVAWASGKEEEKGIRIGVRLEKPELLGLARILWLKWE